MRSFIVCGLTLAALALCGPAQAQYYRDRDYRDRDRDRDSRDWDRDRYSRERDFRSRGPRIPLTSVYRFFNESNGDHLYTTNPDEIRSPLQGYQYEGPAFAVAARPSRDFVPLYRFLTENGIHFYTPDRRIGRRFGRLEGPAGYIARARLRGTVPLYAWYNPDTGAHLYTIDPQGEDAPDTGFRYEGKLGYVFPAR